MIDRKLVLRAVGLGLKAAALLAFLPPLLTRLVMGQAFYQTGSGKLRNIENVVGFFTDLGIPFPELNAAFVSRLEYYGGMLLVVGLATRLVAFLLSSTMVVALMTADSEGFFEAARGASEIGLTDIVPFVYLMFLVWLVVFGPGPVSLDALVARKLKLAKAAAPEGDAAS